MTKPATRVRRHSSRGADMYMRSNRGFTLIELFVVLVIVAIVISIALPSFSVLTYRTKLKSYANEVVASAYLARSEAIKRNDFVTMCVAAATDDVCKGSGSWEEGWVVIDPNQVIIKRQQGLSAGIVLFEATSINNITFEPSGVSNTGAMFTLCQATNAPVTEEKIVRLTATGRPRIETKRDGCSP